MFVRYCERMRYEMYIDLSLLSRKAVAMNTLRPRENLETLKISGFLLCVIFENQLEAIVFYTR